MTKTAFRHASYQDIIDLPENIVGEIINGHLETHPRPTPRHALASSSLGAELVSPFQQGKGGPGGWWIIDEPECHLGSHVLVPDLAGWCRHRMPTLPETAWFETVPDWVCEILSPSTTRVDRIVKMPIYAELGVGYLWLIDPVLQTLEAYELHDRHWLLSGSYADDDPIAIAPFAEHTFSLSDLWE
ncbi:Uma2 family endonuclease [Methylobacter sp.]|uniref:Uma2 family endonuclease n=1 Tax=Methylobacter sp. TaxID=2051955 RepID=UPI003DA2274A